MDRREHFDDPLEAIRCAIEGSTAGLWTALPGIVDSYDHAAQTVAVQPAIAGVIEDDEGRRVAAALPLLVDVPVCFPAGGGFTLTFPVQRGDECIVVFSARCIDAWWQSGGVQPQAERRMHDLSDGMAILGIRSQPRVLAPAADTAAVQLRADDASQYVSIHPGGTVEVKAVASLTLAAPQVVIKGALSVTGINGGPTTARLEGSLAASGDLDAGGVSLRSHVHGGVTPGGGNTGGPQ
ncbi:Gp138 family membrane-puncturing spike protein [Telmatospirillum sp. J64-1]|uniref:Gp138 family membrane-puncturing spike protein n=1 Tax=Telmatospirillum sp. J64-1 TaxID=2502183 RepID=UPI00115C96D6|nr:Gp138 family membrane-puncturing spike protein [Telmatospirillum sp. J64-1]